MTKTAQGFDGLDAYLKQILGEANCAPWNRDPKVQEHIANLNRWLATLSLAQASQARTDGRAVPVYWQWRRKCDRWSTDFIFNSEPAVTTDDSEKRALFEIPPGNATQAAGAREPLSEEQMESMYDKASAEVYRCRHDYYAGILDAERAHGIASPAAELKKD